MSTFSWQEGGVPRGLQPGARHGAPGPPWPPHAIPARACGHVAPTHSARSCSGRITRARAGRAGRSAGARPPRPPASDLRRLAHGPTRYAPGVRGGRPWPPAPCFARTLPLGYLFIDTPVTRQRERGAPRRPVPPLASAHSRLPGAPYRVSHEQLVPLDESVSARGGSAVGTRQGDALSPGGPEDFLRGFHRDGIDGRPDWEEVGGGREE